MTSRRVLPLAGWALVAVVVAAWLALVEVFWLPLRVGGVLLPLSIPMAVLGNLLVTDRAMRLSGSRAVAALPALTWLVVAVGATIRRPEGDLVLVGGGVAGAVGLAFLLIGALAAVLAVGRVLSRPRPATGAGPARTSTPERDPAGSGTGGAR